MSKAPVSILTQLANVHLPKAVWTTPWKDPAQGQRPAVSGTSRKMTERVGEPFDILMARALAVLAPFIKAGVSALSLGDAYYRDDVDWSFRMSVRKSVPLKVAYPCSLLVASLAEENAMGRLVDLDLGKLDVAFFLDYNRLLKAVAKHGKLLKRLILVDTRNLRSDVRGWTNMNAAYFIPAKDGSTGAFVDGNGDVPCPNLECVSFFRNVVSPVVLADFLLSHPKITYFGCMEMADVLLVVEEKIHNSPEAFKEWASSKITSLAADLVPHGDYNSFLEAGDTGESYSWIAESAAHTMQLIEKYCPEVRHLKLVVEDHLFHNHSTVKPNLTHVDSLVLFYKSSMGYLTETHSVLDKSTFSLLSGHGWKLSCLGICSRRLTVKQLAAIGKSCPNLSELSIKFKFLIDDSVEGTAERIVIAAGVVESGSFLHESGSPQLWEMVDEFDATMGSMLGVEMLLPPAPGQVDQNQSGDGDEAPRLLDVDVSKHFKNLEALRVVQVNTRPYYPGASGFVDVGVLRYLLKDKPKLKTCVIGAADPIPLTDAFIQDWVSSNWTPNIESVYLTIDAHRFPPAPPLIRDEISVGPLHFHLTLGAVEELTRLPKIRTIGNVDRWWPRGGSEYEKFTEYVERLKTENANVITFIKRDLESFNVQQWDTFNIDCEDVDFF